MKRWLPKVLTAVVAFVSVQIVLEFIDVRRWREFHERIHPIFVSSSVGPVSLPEARVLETFGHPTNECECPGWKVWTYRPGPALYLFSRRIELLIQTEGEFQGTCSGYEPIYPLNDFLRTFGCNTFPQ